MCISEVYASVNLLGTLGFTQDKTDRTKFYLPMKGDVTFVNKDDTQAKFYSNLEVTLNPDTIVMTYDKYATLEATDANMHEGIAWVSCKRTIPHQVDKLISEISYILSEIYGSTIYEFNNCGEHKYSSKTIADITKKD